MHDQPEPTPEEHEQVPERQQEEERKSYPEFDDPDTALERDEEAAG